MTTNCDLRFTTADAMNDEPSRPQFQANSSSVLNLREVRRLGVLSAIAMLGCLSFLAPRALAQTLTFTGVEGGMATGVADSVNRLAADAQPISTNLGQVNLGVAHLSTLNFTVAATGILGTTKVVTGGTANLDFTLASGSTCVGTVTAGATCKVKVKFTPKFAGLREGAVELTDTGGNILSTILIYGTGMGPQMSFGPGGVGVDVLATGLNYPGAVAADAAGNVFIADTQNHRIVEVPIGGGAQITIPTTGLLYPAGVAVDGAGNIFVVDSGYNTVVEIPIGGGAQITLPTVGLDYPSGLAVDALGNIFIADSFNNRVVELPVGGGAQFTLPATGLNTPGEVAVDGAGNIYIADSFNNRIVKLPIGGGTQISIGTGLKYPQGVAVDAAGDIFIADTSNSRILEVPADGAGQITFFSGFVLPPALAVDPAGNLFIADSDHNRVLEVQRSSPPPIAFAATYVGSTSQDSPQSMTVQNIGNTTMTGTGLSLSNTTDFAQEEGSGTPADCTSSFVLTAGARCNLNLSFNPESAGLLTSSVTLTDNARNVSGTTQVISLSGIGVGFTAPLALLSTTALDFGTTPFGSPMVTKQITVTNIGGQVLTILGSINGPSFTLASTACGGGLTAGSSCVLTVQYAATTVGPHTDILTLATNGVTNPTVRLTSVATGVGAKSTEMNYNPTTIGSTQTLPLTILNSGVPGPVSVGLSINGPSYKVTGSTCGAGLNPNQSCTLQITFIPQTAAKHYCWLTVTAGNGTVTRVRLKGFGL